jgi:hypothetical protein
VQKSLLDSYIQEPIREIQINPVPYPFHLTMPYVIWVNGERLDIPKKEIILIAKEFNLSLDPPKNTALLHNGAGWQDKLANRIR